MKKMYPLLILCFVFLSSCKESTSHTSKTRSEAVQAEKTENEKHIDICVASEAMQLKNDLYGFFEKKEWGIDIEKEDSLIADLIKELMRAKNDTESPAEFLKKLENMTLWIKEVSSPETFLKHLPDLPLLIQSQHDVLLSFKECVEKESWSACLSIL